MEQQNLEQIPPKRKKRKRKRKKNPQTTTQTPKYKCEACEQPMTKPKGYAETGLCGVCATGESQMLNEFGDTW